MSDSGPIAGNPRPIFNRLKIGLVRLLDLAVELQNFSGDLGGALPNGFLKSISKANTKTIVVDPLNPYYTVLSTDFILSFDCSASPVTVYLPEITTDGSPALIIKMKNGTNAATILPWSTNTILTGNQILLTKTDLSIVLFNDAISEWFYFDNPVPGNAAVAVSGTPPSTATAIARYLDTTGLVIENSNVLIDDTGNIIPVTPDTQGVGAGSQNFLFAWISNILSDVDMLIQPHGDLNLNPLSGRTNVFSNVVPSVTDAKSLGNGLIEWLNIYALTLQGLASLSLVSNGGTLIARSIGGDLDFYAGVNERHFDSTNTELFNLIYAAGKRYAQLLAASLVFSTDSTPPNMSAGQTQIYKGSSANTLLYMGEDNVIRLLTFPVDSTGVFQAILDMGSHKIQNVTDPAAAQDAATKNYVDSVVAALNPAVAVQAATTVPGDTSSYTYLNGAGGIGATLTGLVNTPLTVDGFTFTTLGQRILVKDDTQGFPGGQYNGVYYVTQLQTSLLPVILTRALDYDQPSDINNTGAIPVVNGTAFKKTSWLLMSTVNTVGTDPLTYNRFSIDPSTIVTSVSGSAPIASSGGATPTISLNTNGVTNALLAQMAAKTLKGNNTGSTANAVDLTVAQVLALLGLTAVGPIGFPGDPGDDGSDGLPGVQGPVGLTGATGPSGPTGLQGPQGVSGADGLDSEEGPSGLQTTRFINTNAPITGGGDLNTDRTFAIAKSTSAVDGYIAAIDFAVFSAASAGYNQAFNGGL